MSIARNVARNTGVLVAGQVVNKTILFALTIVIARMLGAIEFGKFSFALAFAVLFYIIADFGLTRLTIREVSRDRGLTNRYWTNIAMMKLFMSAITFGLIFTIINLLRYPVDVRVAVYLAGAYTILESFTDFCYALFRAHQRMEFESATIVIEKLIVLGLALAFLLQGLGIIAVLWAFLIGMIVRFLLSVIAVFIVLKPRFAFDTWYWWPLLREGFPFWGMFILGVLYVKIDMTMLSLMQGDAAVGLYGAAYNIILGLALVPLAFVEAIYPIISRFFMQSQRALQESYEKALKYIITLLLPIAFGGVVLGGRIMSLVYGEAYVGASLAFQILIVSYVFIGLTYLFEITLVSIDQEKKLNRNLLIGLGLNVVLNAVLIPFFSLNGAAVATLLSDIVMVALNFQTIRVNMYRFVLEYVKPLIAAVVMGVSVFFMIPLNIFFIVIVAVLIYGGLLLLMKHFTARDKELFMELVKQ